MTIKAYLRHIQKEGKVGCVCVCVYFHYPTFFFLGLYLTLSWAQCHISISLCIF